MRFDGRSGTIHRHEGGRFTDQTLRGVILLADITGYSVYLRDSELAHAQGTLRALLEILVDNTRPPLAVSKLEGDAVLSYGLGDLITGQAFVEMIEATYVAFRKALDVMVMNTSCDCNACVNIAQLDLKFFVHYGEFAVAKVAGHEELQGAEVNLAHRLLKNTIAATTGVGAYVFYTDAAVAALDLAAFTSAMTAHSEDHADHGTVAGWVQDLEPVWQERRLQPSIVIEDWEVLLSLEVEIAAPLEVVWSRLVNPEHRKVAIGSDRQEATGDRDGRMAEDSVYICYHGDRVVTQVILEWVPFERMVSRDLTPLPGGKTYVLNEFQLDRSGTGTRLVQRVTRPEGPRWSRVATRLVLPRLAKQFQRDLDSFRDLIEAALPVTSAT